MGWPQHPPEKLPWHVEGAGKCGDKRRKGAERRWRCRAGAGEQGEGDTGWVGCTPVGLGLFHPKVFTGGLGVLGALPLVPVKRLILAGGAPVLRHHQPCGIYRGHKTVAPSPPCCYMACGGLAGAPTGGCPLLSAVRGIPPPQAVS